MSNLPLNTKYQNIGDVLAKRGMPLTGNEGVASFFKAPATPKSPATPAPTTPQTFQPYSPLPENYQFESQTSKLNPPGGFTYGTPNTDTTVLRSFQNPDMPGQMVLDKSQPNRLLMSERAIDVNPEVKKLLLNGRPSFLYQVDHIIPVWAGGADTPENYEVLRKDKHDQKSMAQNVAYTLLTNGKITEAQAKMMILDWKNKDQSILSLEKFKENPFDLQEAERVKSIWDKQSIEGKPLTWKDWIKAIPVGLQEWTKQAQEGVDITAKKNAEMFGPTYGAFTQQAGSLPISMVKGITSGISFGWQQYEPSESDTWLNKAVEFTGNMYGSMVPISMVTNGLLGGTTRLAQYANKFKSADTLAKQSMAKAAGIDLGAVNAQGLRVVLPGKDAVTQALRKTMTDNFIKATLVPGAISWPLYSQLGPGGAAGNLFTGADNDVGNLFMRDLFLGVAAPLAPGLIRTPGRIISKAPEGLSKWGNIKNSFAQPEALGGVALDSLKVGGAAMMIGLMAHDSTTDALSNAALMTIMHATGAMQGAKEIKTARENATIPENVMWTEAQRMSNNLLNTYVPDLVPKLKATDEVPSQKYTAKQLKNIEKEAQTKIDRLLVDGDLTAEEHSQMQKQIQIALKVQTYDNLPPDMLETMIKDDFFSLANQYKTLGGKSPLVPSGFDTVVSIMEQDGLLKTPISSKPAADPTDYPKGEFRLSGMASVNNAYEETSRAFLTAKANGKASPNLVGFDRPELAPKWRAINNSITDTEVLGHHKVLIERPENGIEWYATWWDDNGVKNFAPIGWSPRKSHIDTVANGGTKTSFNEGLVSGRFKSKKANIAEDAFYLDPNFNKDTQSDFMKDQGLRFTYATMVDDKSGFSKSLNEKGVKKPYIVASIGDDHWTKAMDDNKRLKMNLPKRTVPELVASVNSTVNPKIKMEDAMEVASKETRGADEVLDAHMDQIAQDTQGLYPRKLTEQTVNTQLALGNSKEALRQATPEDMMDKLYEFFGVEMETGDAYVMFDNRKKITVDEMFKFISENGSPEYRKIMKKQVLPFMNSAVVKNWDLGVAFPKMKLFGEKDILGSATPEELPVIGYGKKEKASKVAKKTQETPVEPEVVKTEAPIVEQVPEVQEATGNVVATPATGTEGMVMATPVEQPKKNLGKIMSEAATKDEVIIPSKKTTKKAEKQPTVVAQTTPEATKTPETIQPTTPDIITVEYGNKAPVQMSREAAQARLDELMKMQKGLSSQEGKISLRTLVGSGTGALAGIEKDEEGNYHYNMAKGIAGMAAGAGLANFKELKAGYHAIPNKQAGHINPGAMADDIAAEIQALKKALGIQEAVVSAPVKQKRGTLMKFEVLEKGEEGVNSWFKGLSNGVGNKSALNNTTREKLTDIAKDVSFNGKKIEEGTSEFVRRMTELGKEISGNPSFTIRPGQETKDLKQLYHKLANSGTRQTFTYDANGKPTLKDSKKENIGEADLKIQQYNEENGTNMEVITMDRKIGKSKAFKDLGDEDFIDSRKKLDELNKTLKNVGGNEFIPVGLTAKGTENLVAVKYDPKLVEKFAQTPEKYLNLDTGEVLKTNQQKFLRVFQVDVMGLPKSLKAGDMVKRANILFHKYDQYIGPDMEEPLNIHILKAKKINEEPSFKVEENQLENPGSAEAKSTLQTFADGSILDGKIIMGEKAADRYRSGFNMDPAHQINGMKLLFSGRELNTGEKLLHKGHVIVADPALRDWLKTEYGFDLSADDVVSFDTNAKIGPGKDKPGDFQIRKGDVYNKTLGVGYEGTAKVSLERKFRNADVGVAADMLDATTRYKDAYEGLIKKLNATSNKEDLVKVIDEYADEFGLNKENLFKDTLARSFELGAGKISLAHNLEKLTKNLFFDTVFSHSLPDSSRVFSTFPIKLKLDGPDKPARYPTNEEIVLGKEFLEKNHLKDGDRAMVIRDPSTDLNNTLIVTVRDGSALGNTSLSFEHGFVSPYNERLKLQGDQDGDKILVAKIGKGGVPESYADAVLTRGQKAIPFTEVNAVEKGGGFVTPENLDTIMKMQLVGDDQTSMIATANRIMDMVDDNGIKVIISNNLTQDNQGRNRSPYQVTVNGKVVDKGLTAPVEKYSVFTPKWGPEEKQLRSQAIQEAVDSKKSADIMKRTDNDPYWMLGQVFTDAKGNKLSPKEAASLSGSLVKFQKILSLPKHQSDYNNLLAVKRAMEKPLEMFAAIKRSGGKMTPLQEKMMMLNKIEDFRIPDEIRAAGDARGQKEVKATFPQYEEAYKTNPKVNAMRVTAKNLKEKYFSKQNPLTKEQKKALVDKFSEAFRKKLKSGDYTPEDLNQISYWAATSPEANFVVGDKSYVYRFNEFINESPEIASAYYKGVESVPYNPGSPTTKAEVDSQVGKKTAEVVKNNTK